MRVTHRIPTTQYGYVEVEEEFTRGELSASLIKEHHDRLLDAFAEKPQNTLSDKEMVDYIYNALHGLPNSPDVWETMHPLQKQVLKCYRNAKERKAPLKEKVTK